MTRLATFVVLASCAAPAKPSFAPGQVISLEDGTLTTRDDQSIEITVHRVFAAHEANGSVVLKDLTVDEARRSPLRRVARGRAWLQIVHAIEAPEQGYVAAMRGLEDMGTEYRQVKKPMLDDTGMHVKLAKITAELHGEYASALLDLERVYESRIHAYLVVFKQNRR